MSFVLRVCFFFAQSSTKFLCQRLDVPVNPGDGQMDKKLVGCSNAVVVSRRFHNL